MPQLLAFAKNMSARALGRTPRAPAQSTGTHGLAAFQAEDGPAGRPASSPKPPPRPARRRATGVWIAAVALALTSSTVVYVATRSRTPRVTVPVAPAMGTAILNSTPQAAVTIDGQPRGQTPLSLQLTSGTHVVVVTAGQISRSIPLEIEAGTTTRQNVEFATAAPATTGRLDVTSDPPGARVNVDGTPRGTTPLSLSDVAAGQHQLTISSGDNSIRRRVTVLAGAVASVDASIAAPDSSAGWLSLTSPVELTLTEDDQIVGTTKAARLMLPAGNHNLVLSNPALEFQTTMPVRIEGGKMLKRSVPLPNGSLSVNAVPWANVSVDGSDVGTTPLANISLPIGTHEVVWRHPQFGERRRTIAVTTKTPTRVGMDFKQ